MATRQDTESQQLNSKTVQNIGRKLHIHTADHKGRLNCLHPIKIAYHGCDTF